MGLLPNHGELLVRGSWTYDHCVAGARGRRGAAPPRFAPILAARVMSKMERGVARAEAPCQLKALERDQASVLLSKRAWGWVARAVSPLSAGRPWAAPLPPAPRPRPVTLHTPPLRRRRGDLPQQPHHPRRARGPPVVRRCASSRLFCVGRKPPAPFSRPRSAPRRRAPSTLRRFHTPVIGVLTAGTQHRGFRHCSYRMSRTSYAFHAWSKKPPSSACP